MQKQGRPVNTKMYVRSVIAVALFSIWGLVAFTGLLLWLAPTGPRAGRQLLLLGFTKSDWGDIHFWTSVAAVSMTLVHIAIDWRGLRACVRYLASVQRGQESHRPPP